MPYIGTTAVGKLITLTKKIRDVRGSTGAGKTVGILLWDIDYAQKHERKVIDVVSESYPHLEQGVIREFKNIMSEQGYLRDERWNASKHIYTFETGSTIQFQSYDKLGKAHGPRRDILHLNEANWLPWEVVNNLIVRTRDVVWCEYNPLQEFWMQVEIIGKRNDVESLKLTYLDNEGLSESERLEIESRRNNPRWWKVYGEGEFGDAEGRIYTGWQLIDEIPHEARLERYGLDFGYDPDPAAIVAVYWYNGGYILDEVLYAPLMDNPKLASTFKNLSPALVIADSAEPKSIAEISNFGVSIIGALKGKDSVRYGVKTVQAQRISVTKRSVNIIKEHRNLFQAVDKLTNIPIMGEYEGVRHALDAVRMAICSILPIKAAQDLHSAQGQRLFAGRPRRNMAL